MIILSLFDSGPRVAVLCEYDALPRIGHACGHNLIAEIGVGAALGIQAAFTKAKDAGHQLGQVSDSLKITKKMLNSIINI